MLLNLLNLFSLIIALFKKINKMNGKLDELRQCHEDELTTTTAATTGMSTIFSSSPTNDPSGIVEATTIFTIIHAATSDLFPNLIPKLTTIATTTLSENVKNVTQCARVLVDCSKTTTITPKTMFTTLLALNFTSTILPEIRYQSTGGSTVSSYTDYYDFTTENISFATFSTNMYDNRSTTDYFDNVTAAPDGNGEYTMHTTTKFPYDSMTTVKSDYETADFEDSYDYQGKLVMDFIFISSPCMHQIGRKMS